MKALVKFLRTSVFSSLAFCLIAPASLSVFGSDGFAGIRDVGNGGGGIRKNGHVYVLDLVEAGVERKPFFDAKIAPRKDLKNRVEKALANLPSVPSALISQKLAELSEYDTGLPLLLTEVIEMYSWRAVDLTLAHISDARTVIAVQPSEQVQLAARSETSIKIDKLLWAQLDSANRAALVLHEAVYALIKSKSSDEAREIVGYLFMPDFKSRGANGFLTLVQNKLPLIGTEKSYTFSRGGEIGVAWGTIIELTPIGPSNPHADAILRERGDTVPRNRHSLDISGGSLEELTADVSDFCEIAAPGEISIYQSEQECTLEFSGDAIDYDCLHSYRERLQVRGIYNRNYTECVKFLPQSLLPFVSQFNSSDK